MDSSAHEVMWRRLRYMLTPQWDIYMSLRGKMKGKRVLEVGFGTGAGVLQYCGDARLVDAIEPDPGAVDFASKSFPLSRVNWMLEDIITYNPNMKYDAVVMIETLEHIPEWERALENIRSLLVNGGMLVISSRNKNADLRRWKDLHEREWTAREFKDALSYFFPIVTLYDFSLKRKQEESTRLTPLVAIAMTKKIIRWMP